MTQLNDLLSNVTNIKNDIKQAIINKGQTVTNFASYPNAILNIQTGRSGDEGDIKLFSTVEELNNDPDAQEGDLACVYTEGNLINFYEYKTNIVDKNSIGFHSIDDIEVIIENDTKTVNFLNNPPILEVSAQKLENITTNILNEVSWGGMVGYFIDTENNLKACILYKENNRKYDRLFKPLYYRY